MANNTSNNKERLKLEIQITHLKVKHSANSKSDDVLDANDSHPATNETEMSVLDLERKTNLQKKNISADTWKEIDLGRNDFRELRFESETQTHSEKNRQDSVKFESHMKDFIEECVDS